MELFRLTEAQRELAHKVETMARERFAPRANEYDGPAIMPKEDILDLHREGLLLAAAPKAYGGLGFGCEQDDPLSFFLVTENIAKVNPATGHCYQVHNNCVQMIHAFGNETQKEKYLEPTRERAALLPGAGSEPTMHVATGRMLTDAKHVDGGVMVSGIKHYATNASASEWMWVMVIDEKTERDLTVMIPSDHPGVTIKEEFWDPSGVRACVSPVIEFKEVFVPEEDILGQPGDFLGNDWLGKINLGFSFNYLGTMQGIYEHVVNYLKERNRTEDSMRQTYIGEMKARLDALRLMLYSAVSGFQADPMGAMLAIEEAKFLAIETANRFQYLVGQACGPTILFRKYPVERLLRDLALHGLHGRHYQNAITVGKSELGQPFKVGLSV